MRVALATEPASPARPNGDFAALTGTLAVLLDGTADTESDASTSGSVAACPHDARWYTRALGTRLLAELSAEPPVWIAEGVARAIEAVAASHAGTCPIDDRTHPSATVAILRELPDVYEYYILGDSTIVFGTAEGQVTVRNDRSLNRVASAERARLAETRWGTPERESALAALRRVERAMRNMRGGYWVASTNPDAAARGRQGHIGRRDLRRAALLSDGAAAAVDRFGLMDWESALNRMEREGPQAIIRAVRDAEESDPRGERWPRGEPHDDATAVLCLPDVDKARGQARGQGRA